jgi:hypothetical protein
VIGTHAIDPGINLVGIDVETGVEFGTSLSDAVSLPGKTVPALGLGLLVLRERSRLCHGHSIACRQRGR